jgi:glutamate dehydrogenase
MPERRQPSHKPHLKRPGHYNKHWRSKMTQQPNDLRKQTLDLVQASAPAGDNGQVPALIAAWLGAIDDEDLAGVSPRSIAPALWDGFRQAARRVAQGCQIAQLRYDDGRGAKATALLVVNDDMPYLVDSMVMAMRRERVGVAAVLNAVLPVKRDAGVTVVAFGEAGAPL